MDHTSSGVGTPAPHEWLRPHELAPLIKTTTQSLASMRHSGTGPRFYKPSGRILYRWSDVEAWIEASAHTATRERVSISA